MNFWKMIDTKWNREVLSSWSSFKKTAYMILPLLIYFLVHDGAEVVLWGLLNQIMLICGEETASFFMQNGYTVRGIVNGLAILTGVAAVWKAVRSEIETEIEAEGKTDPGGKGAEHKNDKRVTTYMLLGALAFLSALGLNLLFCLLGITESSQAFEDTAAAQFGVAFWIGLLLYGGVSPFAEEAVFRGLLYNRMKRCFPYPVALMVSSLLFGCYHGNLVQAAYGTLLGLLIAYVYEKYESFAAPVLFHSVANVSIYAVTYHNRLGSLDKRVSIGMTVFSLVGAGICLWKMNDIMVKKN